MLAAGITAFGALAFALLLDESVSRAVSVGFYLVGSFLTIAGFFRRKPWPRAAEAGRRRAAVRVAHRALGDPGGT